MKVKLQWATPNIDAQIAYQARVSNPDNQSNPQIAGLLNYCMREGHVSPFEMANVCLEVNTTRGNRLYMNGTMRSWVHYLGQRLHPSTQKEHLLIAEQALAVLRGVAPVTMAAFFPEVSRA